jgi:flagellin-like protein
MSKFHRFKSGESIEGVSPIVGIILLVAMTVVLTGIIYAWVGTFSHGSSNEIAYFGYKSEENNNDWEVTILTTDGRAVPFDTFKFTIYNDEDFLIHEKTLADANPKPFTVGSSTIYPIPNNSTPVISKRTTAPITAQDDFPDYIGVLIVFIDFDNDTLLSSGDIIRIYKDFDSDSTDDIFYGYSFAIRDYGDKTNYVFTIF